MSKIISYDHNLGQERATFITPNNEIYCGYSFQTNEHEDLSREYIEGECYKILVRQKERLKNIKDKQDIDIYQSSKLSKEELEAYKVWLQNKKLYFFRSYSDYMLHALGFDRVETMWRKTITTTSFEPHIKYYNYYLMEWNIVLKTKMKYNKETRLFEPLFLDDSSLIDSDIEAKEEIEKIKRKVLIKDRYRFFK